MDPQLAAFLRATDEPAAASALDALLAGPLAAVITDAVRRELGGSFKGADHIEDVVADVRLRLIRRLMSLRSEPESSDTAIENIAAYAAVTAERACYAFLRRQFPERTRFRNRVRYVLSHQKQITFESGAGGVWRASSAAPLRVAPGAGSTASFIEDAARFLRDARIDRSQLLATLIPAVLVKLDRAIEFDRLVDGLAPALGIAETSATRSVDGEDGHEPADPAPAITEVLEQRESLQETWGQIIELPPRQRAALLLNLRDPEGGAVLQMLPATGVVTHAGIAAALGITPGALTALWPRLPLDDRSIAEQLGLTRQQVINLRKSARARLARRLRENRP